MTMLAPERDPKDADHCVPDPGTRGADGLPTRHAVHHELVLARSAEVDKPVWTIMTTKLLMDLVILDGPPVHMDKSTIEYLQLG